MSFSYSSFKPDNSVDTLDDILQTVNSLSKISRNGHSKISKSNSYQRDGDLYNKPLDNSPNFNDLPCHSSFSSVPLNVGRGRGKYMETLAQKFGKEDKSALRDNMILEQLHQINGSAYSNFEIEQRYGYSPVDYTSDYWSTVTDQSTSSSFISTEEKSLSETESEKSHSGQSSIPKKSTSPSTLANGVTNLLIAESVIEEQQCLGDSFSTEDPSCSFTNNEEVTSTELEKKQGDTLPTEDPSCSFINIEEGTEPGKKKTEHVELEERNLYELKKDKFEDVLKKTPKKKKERKCRNIVVLSLTQNINTTKNASPVVRSPPQLAEKKSWILDSKQSIFRPEDFPSL